MDDERPIYNTEDPIPKTTLLISIVQHILALASFMTYPAIIGATIIGTTDATANLISVTFIGCGIATLIITSKRIGTGFPLPSFPNSAYLPAALLATQVGGIALLSGMLIVSGFLEMIISRFTKFFKLVFPDEVSGVVLFILGLAIIPTAFPLFFGSIDSGVADTASTIVGIITLFSIIIISLIPKKFFKFFAIIIGMSIGFVTSILLGVFSIDTFYEVIELPLFAIPTPAFLSGYSFNLALIQPFIIGIICVVMKTAGNLSLLSSYTGKGDKKTLSRGILLEGAGLSITGALGGCGNGTSSSDVGLVMGTGIASRKMGIGIGILLIIFGFIPFFGWMFYVLPSPILEASHIFCNGFLASYS